MALRLARCNLQRIVDGAGVGVISLGMVWFPLVGGLVYGSGL
jgi:hypothetical protein